MALTSQEELDQAIAEERFAERMREFALLAFSAEELDGLPMEQRRVLDLLIKRRMREGGAEPDAYDSLSIRQQFEEYVLNRMGNMLAAQIGAQIRR